MAAEFWFKFYFKDWADDVKPLSLASRGLLMELIIELRKRGGSMPVDVRLISRLTGGLTEEITHGLEEFRAHGIFDFEKTDKGEILKSRKILKEISKSLTNKENGKKGGNPYLKSDNPSVKRKVNRGDNRTPISISDSNSDFNTGSNSRRRGGRKFEPPTPEDVQVFVQMEGFPLELGVHVYKYYNDAEWKDSTGKQVKNWKQKIRGVWLKEENRNYGKQQPTPKTGNPATDRLANSLASSQRYHSGGGG